MRCDSQADRVWDAMPLDVFLRRLDNALRDFILAPNEQERMIAIGDIAMLPGRRFDRLHYHAEALVDGAVQRRGAGIDLERKVYYDLAQSFYAEHGSPALAQSPRLN